MKYGPINLEKPKDAEQIVYTLPEEYAQNEKTLQELKEAYPKNDYMGIITQQHIITRLKNMEETDQTQAEGMKQAKPLFANSFEGQIRGRASKLKKAARNKSAKELAEIDKKRGDELSLVGGNRGLVENPSYCDYISRIAIMEEIKSERKDVTGHERRMRAQSNSKVVLARKQAMERDLDNLVNNMMKDLYLSGEYEPSEEFKDFRTIRQIEQRLEQRMNILSKSVGDMKRRRKEGKDWTDKDAFNLRQTKLEQLKTDMFILYVKGVSSASAADVEIYRTKLEAMKAAKQQLLEDQKVYASAYTTKLIDMINDRIREQELSIRKKIEEVLPEEVQSENKPMSMNEAVRKVADLLGGWDTQKRYANAKQGDERKEEFEKADKIADNIAAMVGRMDFDLNSLNMKNYVQFLADVGYDGDQIQLITHLTLGEVEKMKQL